MNHSKARSSIFLGVFGFLLLLVLASPAAVAQHIRGAIEGTVKDPNGAVVQGATVTLKNVGTSVETTAVSNDEGRFNFQNVEPGIYSVAVSGLFRNVLCFN